MQTQFLGLLVEKELELGIDEGEAAATSPKEFDGAEGIGELRLGAEEEDQARLVIAH